MLVQRIRPAGAAGRVGQATLTIGALVVLAACGSAVAGGHPASTGGRGATPVPGGKASAGVALCVDIPKLTSATVSGATSLHALEPDLVLPRGITIREPLQVRALAGALCGLPESPRGPVNCPAQFIGSLQLAFAAGGHVFRPVSVEVSGCQVVRGLGPARTVPSPVFWRTLSKDLGLEFPRSTGQPRAINP